MWQLARSEVNVAFAFAPSSLLTNSQFLRLCGHPHKRKNWLFAGSDEGGKRAAILLSVIKTAERAGVDVRAYLHDVIVKIAGGWKMSRIDELLPQNWTPATGAGNRPGPPDAYGQSLSGRAGWREAVDRLLERGVQMRRRRYVGTAMLTTVLWAAACDDPRTTEVRQLNSEAQLAEAPPAEYDEEKNQVLPPPVLITRTPGQMADEEAAALAQQQSAYTTQGWQDRVANTASSTEAAVVLAVVRDLEEDATGSSSGYRLSANVELATASIEESISIRQAAEAKSSSSEWRLRVPKKPEQRYLVVLVASGEPGVYDLVVDYSRNIVGFGFEVAPDTFEMPGGPSSLHLSELSLASVN